MQFRNYLQNHNVLVGTTPPFYMRAYIMDSICFSYYFSSLGWKWTNQYPTPIHIYFDILWESKYHPNFYKIFLEVTVPIHVFGSKAPRVTVEANRDLNPIGKWFTKENFTYIHIFGS